MSKKILDELDIINELNERTQKDGTKKAIDCHLAVKEYTKRMGGVDRFDQVKSSYSVGRRSKRWWVRIFYFLLDASITNVILYCTIYIVVLPK